MVFMSNQWSEGAKVPFAATGHTYIKIGSIYLMIASFEAVGDFQTAQRHETR